LALKSQSAPPHRVTKVTRELAGSTNVGSVIFDLKVENGGADGTRTL
jgi:hypothetical protein